MTAAHVLLAARLATGALATAQPQSGLRLLSYPHNTRNARALVRLLGLRHLIQGTCEAGADRDLLRAGACVDLLHAASALSFAQLSRPGRQAGRRSAAVAVTFAACQLLLANNRTAQIAQRTRRT